VNKMSRGCSQREPKNGENAGKGKDFFSLDHCGKRGSGAILDSALGRRRKRAQENEASTEHSINLVCRKEEIFVEHRRGLGQPGDAKTAVQRQSVLKRRYR